MKKSSFEIKCYSLYRVVIADHLQYDSIKLVLNIFNNQCMLDGCADIFVDLLILAINKYQMFQSKKGEKEKSSDCAKDVMNKAPK